MKALFDFTAIVRLIARNQTLFTQLLRRDLANRYKGSALGIFWSIALPFLRLLIYTMVFTCLFTPRKIAGDVEISRLAYSTLIFSGMTVVMLFSEVLTGSCMLVLSNPNYVKKVIFPLELLPVERTLVVFIFGIAWWILLFFGAAFLIGSLSWTMLFLPLTLIPLVLLACGCSFFCAATTVYLRDTRQVVEVIAQILMFATPVFYQLSMISEKYRWIFLLNPLTIIVEETRKFFLFKTMPDFLLCGLLWCVSIVVFQFGYAWFTRLKKGFANVL